MKVAKGILTDGLTGRDGHPSAMILGRFRLGPLSINIGGGPASPRPQGPIKPKKDSIDINIKVQYKKSKWEKNYLVDKKYETVVIKITKFINTIVDNVTVSVHNIRQTFNKITVNIWRKKD